jgi:hypothetical protein
MCYSRKCSVARNCCSLGKSMQRSVARNLTEQRRQKSLRPWQKHAGLCHASSSSCRSLHVLSALWNPANKSKLSCTQDTSTLRNESRLECKALTGISLLIPARHRAISAGSPPRAPPYMVPTYAVLLWTVATYEFRFFGLFSDTESHCQDD